MASTRFQLDGELLRGPAVPGEHPADLLVDAIAIDRAYAPALVNLGGNEQVGDGLVLESNAIVAVGEGIVSVLGTGAKKTKYATCPVPSKPVRLLAIADGVLLGGQQGLFHSTDGLEWKQISSAPVMALVDSKSGPLVVSPKAEVFALRH